MKAQQLAPKNGRPYNQLAILALYTVSATLEFSHFVTYETLFVRLVSHFISLHTPLNTKSNQLHTSTVFPGK